MNGIHDMGGMHGFGRVEPDGVSIHHDWERRVIGMVVTLGGRDLYTIDAFRHAIERMTPREYLNAPYFVRWRTAIEGLLKERGVVTRAELLERFEALRRGEDFEPVPTEDPSRYPRVTGGPGYYREISGGPRFAEGESVRARNLHPRGHTRLPRYVRGKVGTVARVYGAYVFPDTQAHDEGENPQYLYNVRFEGRTLWGPNAEPSSSVHIDLFESYLDAAGEVRG